MRSPDERFESPLHEARTAAILGIALGASFTICLTTGLYSHLQQHPVAWLPIPARPAGLYRVTQGVHVVTGTATVPLLLAKLWVVFPHFVKLPPVRSVAHAIERLALLPLVGGALFLLGTGIANVARYYPFPFYFPTGHYWAAWLTIGAMVAHIGAKLTITRDALRRAAVDAALVRATTADRRAFIGGVAAASGAVVLATVGGTVTALSDIAVLAQREAGTGPQGLPVNQTAMAAGVLDKIRDPAWRLVVQGAIPATVSLSLADLRAMPQHEAVLPIACVEGWSMSARWSGVPVRDLLARAGAAPGAEVFLQSMEEGGRYGGSTLDAGQAHDRDTLLALDLDGEPLDLDHGFPVRLIAPNRPGVLQTKWVGRLDVR